MGRGRKRSQSPFHPPGHGNHSDYANKGCRCSYCTLANTDVQRVRKGLHKNFLTEDQLTAAISLMDEEVIIQILKAARRKRDNSKNGGLRTGRVMTDSDFAGIAKNVNERAELLARSRPAPRTASVENILNLG